MSLLEIASGIDRPTASMNPTRLEVILPSVSTNESLESYGCSAVRRGHVIPKSVVKGRLKEYLVSITEEIDTHSNDDVYVVRLLEKFSPVALSAIRGEISRLGGKYSIMKDGFIFRDNPALYPCFT